MQDQVLEKQKTDAASLPSTAISLWSQWGSLLLLGSFAALLLKNGSLYWSLALTAFVGYMAILFLKKSGLYFSLLLLMGVSICLVQKGGGSLWSLILALSMGCSWVLIFLGYRENQVIQEDLTKQIFFLEDNCRYLEKQLHEAREVISKKNKEEIVKQMSSCRVPQEEAAPEERRWEHQYANLREQFEEKSAALDQARRDLFSIENELFVQQKMWEEKLREISEEEQRLIKDYKMMDEELHELETQVCSLQECLTVILSPKKRPLRSKKSVNKRDQQERLPFLLKEKIDHISSERAH